MCGIFGFSGIKPNTSKLKILALYNESRGGHATGIYSDKIGVLKDKLPADVFIAYYSNEFRANNMFFGHTRYKTHGANTVQNAHPFIFNNIVGVHNGVISNYQQIAKEYNQVIEVDSQCIFLAIANNQNNEEAILPDIVGAMAIAYTKGDSLLYLYRRVNPIYIGYTKYGMYFSSMEESLFAIDCNKVQLLKEHKIYIFNNGKLIKQIEVDIPKVEALMNWTDFMNGESIQDTELFYYDSEDLLELGVSDKEIEMLQLMNAQEQEAYLVKHGYLNETNLEFDYYSYKFSNDN